MQWLKDLGFNATLHLPVSASKQLSTAAAVLIPSQTCVYLQAGCVHQQEINSSFPVMWNSTGFHNSEAHSQVLPTHTYIHTQTFSKIYPDAWEQGEDEVINTHAGNTGTREYTWIWSSHTWAVFPALSGCGDGSVMASLWADVQLGMWDVQAGIPGTTGRLRAECYIDREVWRGNEICVRRENMGRRCTLTLSLYGMFDKPEAGGRSRKSS